MSIRSRYFILEEDGKLFRVSQKSMDGLVHGCLIAPKFAGKRWRMVQVVLDVEGRNPVRVAAVIGSYLYLDDNGLAQNGLIEGAFGGITTYEALKNDQPTRGIISEAQVDRRRWERKYRWEPTPADISRLIQIIWPAKGAARERIQSVEIEPFTPERQGELTSL